jgi:hypothetical protein
MTNRIGGLIGAATLTHERHELNLKESLNKSILDFSGHEKQKMSFLLFSGYQTLACLIAVGTSLCRRNL